MATDLDRIDDLLSDQEASVRRAFLDYVRLVRSDQVMALITERLEARDVAGAFQIVDSYIGRMADVLPEIQRLVGQHTVGELAALIPQIAVALSFDSSHPRAAALVRTQRLGLIREFSQSQLRAIQQGVNRALNNGLGAQETARAFRDAVGLTYQQESYVASYRRSLVNQSRDALDRALRDQRFDDRVTLAIEGGRPLTERQIDIMVERYRARAIMARAETIARSEAGRATAEAREESVRQMVEITRMKPERVKRRWHVTRDGRERDWHASMDGQLRGLDERFVDGLGQQLRYPHDPDAPANTTINCRCPLTFEISDPA